MIELAASDPGWSPIIGALGVIIAAVPAWFVYRHGVKKDQAAQRKIELADQGQARAQDVEARDELINTLRDERRELLTRIDTMQERLDEVRDRLTSALQELAELRTDVAALRRNEHPLP